MQAFTSSVYLLTFIQSFNGYTSITNMPVFTHSGNRNTSHHRAAANHNTGQRLRPVTPQTSLQAMAGNNDQAARLRSYQQMADSFRQLKKEAPSIIPAATGYNNVQELNGQPGSLQMIVGPTPLNFAQMEGELGDPTTRPEVALGVTHAPQNPIAPAYKKELVPPAHPLAWHHWSFRLRLLRPAEEGTISCAYLQSGYHNINKSYMGRDRWIYVSNQIATLGRAGELEHAMDYLYAFNQTLLAAEQIITNSAANPIEDRMAEGGAATKEMAAAHFKDGHVLNAIFGNVGSDPQQWLTNYQILGARTRNRDGKHWHSVQLGPITDDPKGWVQQIQPLNTTQIDINNPGSNSAAVIGTL